MVIDEMITTGHARALLGIAEEEQQYAVAQKIFDEKLSVRETEKLIKKLQNQKEDVVKKQDTSSLTIIYQDLEQKLKNIMGTKVSIHTKDHKKGKIEIEYYNKEELDRIVEMFASIHN